MADETNQLRVRLVTPERTLIESCASRCRTALEVRLHGSALRSRTAACRTGRAGDVTVHGCGVSDPASLEGSTRYNVSWGFVEVLPDRVTILASDAPSPSPRRSMCLRRPAAARARRKDVERKPAKSEEAYARSPPAKASSPKPKPQNRRFRNSPALTCASFISRNDKSPAHRAGLFRLMNTPPSLFRREREASALTNEAN